MCCVCIVGYISYMHACARIYFVHSVVCIYCMLYICMHLLHLASTTGYRCLRRSYTGIQPPDCNQQNFNTVSAFHWTSQQSQNTSTLYDCMYNWPDTHAKWSVTSAHASMNQPAGHHIHARDQVTHASESDCGQHKPKPGRMTTQNRWLYAVFVRCVKIVFVRNNTESRHWWSSKELEDAVDQVRVIFLFALVC